MTDQDGLPRPSTHAISSCGNEHPVKKIRLRYERQQAPSPPGGDSAQSIGEWEQIPEGWLYETHVNDGQDRSAESGIKVTIGAESRSHLKSAPTNVATTSQAKTREMVVKHVTFNLPPYVETSQRRTEPYATPLRYKSPPYLTSEHRHFATTQFPSIPEVPKRIICKARCALEWQREDYRRQLLSRTKPHCMPHKRLVAYTFHPPRRQNKRRAMSPIDRHRPDSYRRSNEGNLNAFDQQSRTDRHYTDEECCQIVVGWKLVNCPWMGPFPERLQSLDLNDSTKVIHRTTLRFWKYLQETDQ